MLRKIALFFIGKSILQPIFEAMYFISLVGMNYGIGASAINESGEKNLLKIIKKKLYNKKNKLTLFDVGANRGGYSLAILEIFNSIPLCLYSFEPSKYTFDILNSNLPKTDDIKIFNIGFSNEKSISTLFNDIEGSGESSLYNRNMKFVQREFNQKEKVELTTIDIFCKENNIENIDLLKIDVEGHELNVLNGCKNLLKNKKIKYIQFEFGGTNIDAHTNFKDFYFLLKPNYTIFRILNDGIRELKNYDETKEIYLGINYLAELIEN